MLGLGAGVRLGGAIGGLVAETVRTKDDDGEKDQRDGQEVDADPSENLQNETYTYACAGLHMRNGEELGGRGSRDTGCCGVV